MGDPRRVPQTPPSSRRPVLWIAAGLAIGLRGCAPPPPPSPPTILLTGAGPTASAVAQPTPVDAGVARKKDPSPIAWIDSEPEARGRARRTGQPLLVWIRA